MKLWKFLLFGQVSVTVSKAINGSELTVNRNLLAAGVFPINSLAVGLSDVKWVPMKVLLLCQGRGTEGKT